MTRRGTARNANRDGRGAPAARGHGRRSGTRENSGCTTRGIEVLTDAAQCTRAVRGKDSRACAAPPATVDAYQPERISPAESARIEGRRVLFHQDATLAWA